MVKQSKYYTATEVCNILGANTRQLVIWVKQGTIIREIPPGNLKKGLYLKSSVDAFAAKRAAFFGENEGDDDTDAKKKIA